METASPLPLTFIPPNFQPFSPEKEGDGKLGKLEQQAIALP
ncbi:hypothetical protein [Oscillatoria acuminata]|nr:hypothetical protein [Oscillatoria acuminata]